MTFRHYESNAIVPVQAERLFEFVDDHMSLSAHMDRPSWKTAWSRMETTLDNGRGKNIGSHITLAGRVFGLRLAVEEVVAERNPPRSKVWETVGSPQLLVIGHYRMGFEITTQGGDASLFRVFIDYALPNAASKRWLGLLFGRFYAKWCVRQMVDGAVNHFTQQDDSYAKR